ncbi:Aste57867_1697 [Aphanomyces stellatus]|uniref:Aste57867_1697 protein n=1 Tax=Aphanomyces stellatus TaxID=120398 RepID=A0A485K8G9_9STRA|nr:hypothetical protein As57867_001695 [Aphanomyces stellatus]VFT78908.1 Aste57867_1697 [Aphanomyces stellatus]
MDEDSSTAASAAVRPHAVAYARQDNMRDAGKTTPRPRINGTRVFSWSNISSLDNATTTPQTATVSTIIFAPTTPSTTVQPTYPPSDTTASTSSAVVIGLAIGCLMIVIACALAIYLRRRYQAKSHLSFQRFQSPQPHQDESKQGTRQSSQLVRVNPSTRSSRIDFAPSSGSPDTDLGFGTWQVQVPDLSLPVRTIPSSHVKPLRGARKSFLAAGDMLDDREAARSAPVATSFLSPDTNDDNWLASREDRHSVQIGSLRSANECNYVSK